MCRRPKQPFYVCGQVKHTHTQLTGRWWCWWLPGVWCGACNDDFGQMVWNFKPMQLPSYWSVTFLLGYRHLFQSLLTRTIQTLKLNLTHTYRTSIVSYRRPSIHQLFPYTKASNTMVKGLSSGDYFCIRDAPNLAYTDFILTMYWCVMFLFCYHLHNFKPNRYCDTYERERLCMFCFVCLTTRILLLS